MSYRGFEDEIPQKFVDRIIEEGNHPQEIAFRALIRSSSACIKEDFLPSFLEGAVRSVGDGGLCGTSHYVPLCISSFRKEDSKEKPSFSSFGLSLFADLTELKKTVGNSPILFPSVVGYAEGHTDSNKGITGLPKPNTHFLYFLYNSYDKNPSTDFCVIEKREAGK